MSQFNFQEITKGRFGTSSFPEGVVRVSKGGITLARNIGNRYECYVTPRGATGARVLIEHDPVNQALRLRKDEDKGWAFLTKGDEAPFRLSGGASVVKKGSIVTGDYLETEPGIFVLAR